MHVIGEEKSERLESKLSHLWFPKIRSDRVASLFKSRRRLEVENLFLRHQVNIALWRAPHRVQLSGSDRALLSWMTWLRPSLLGLARVVQPDTILRWHRAGFRAFFAAVASFALAMPMRWIAWSELILRRDSPGLHYSRGRRCPSFTSTRQGAPAAI